MARYQVKLAYDGTDFSGFQMQVSVRTVQAEIEKALRALGWVGQSILFGGRTDAGVHAGGQVVAFDLDWVHSSTDLLRALNANLPQDVAVREVNLASADFHPRFAALRRRYQYRLFCEVVREPLRERYAWRVWPKVDLALMRAAARGLVGTHDFGAFGSPPRAGGNTVRTVFRADWLEHGNDLVFTVEANAFLYHMVRRLVAYQVEIGQGRLEPGESWQRLAAGEQSPQPGRAPSQGLTLDEIIYPSMPE